METVELDHARASQKNLDLVSPRSSTPLRTADIGRVEGVGIAATSRFPAQATFREPGLSALLGQIQVDIVETLSKTKGVRSGSRS